jgi:hypothetical protein
MSGSNLYEIDSDDAACLPFDSEEVTAMIVEVPQLEGGGNNKPRSLIESWADEVESASKYAELTMKLSSMDVPIVDNDSRFGEFTVVNKKKAQKKSVPKVEPMLQIGASNVKIMESLRAAPKSNKVVDKPKNQVALVKTNNVVKNTVANVERTLDKVSYAQLIKSGSFNNVKRDSGHGPKDAVSTSVTFSFHNSPMSVVLNGKEDLKAINLLFIRCCSGKSDKIFEVPHEISWMYIGAPAIE